MLTLLTTLDQVIGKTVACIKTGPFDYDERRLGIRFTDGTAILFNVEVGYEGDPTIAVENTPDLKEQWLVDLGVLSLEESQAKREAYEKLWEHSKEERDSLEFQRLLRKYGKEDAGQTSPE